MKGFLSRLAAKSIAPHLSGLRPKIGSIFEPASGQTPTFMENRWIMPSEDLRSDNLGMEEEQQIDSVDISMAQDEGRRAPTANAKMRASLGEVKPVDSRTSGRKEDQDAYQSEQSHHIPESTVIAEVTSPEYQVEDDDASLSRSQDSGNQVSIPKIGSLTERPSSFGIASDSSSISTRNLPEKEASLPGTKDVEIGDYRDDIKAPTTSQAPNIMADIIEIRPGTSEDTDTSLGRSKSPWKKHWLTKN